MKIYPQQAVASRPKFSQVEKAFVRRFGVKALIVNYSGREDLVGLRMVGRTSGLEIERDTNGSRFMRVLEVIGTQVFRTKRRLPLRFTSSEHNLVPGLRSWVR